MPSSAHRSAAAGQLRPRLGRPAGVLPPHVPAAGAPVAADRDQQRRRPPPERLVRQPPDHGVPRRRPRSRSGGTTASGSTTRQASTARSGSSRWPVTSQPELVEPAERGQVRAGEGSVRHVEVFRMGGVRTPIIGRPRPLRTDAPTPTTPQLGRARQPSARRTARPRQAI